jgi:RNA polymerase sigma factor (sigma-70 family)
MTEITDQRLARRAARGDQRAFEQIYRRYSQDLYRFCLAMLGNPHDAQDTLQNAMVKVLRALPGEEREIKLKPWLYRIARNEAVETLRRRRDLLEPAPERAAPTASQIAERVEDRERLRLLFADLDELPDRQRGALLMRELSGLSFEEIAKAFETSPATARQTVYEARLSLNQMEAGREMPCEEVMKALSDADRRVTRRRDLRAHLRGCAACRAFADGIEERRGELAALGPLPLAASAGILHGVLAGQAAGAVAGSATSAAGLGGSVSGGAGKAIAASAVAKSAATVAVVAVVGVSAADRAGLIDTPLPGHRSEATQTVAPNRVTQTPALGAQSGGVHGDGAAARSHATGRATGGGDSRQAVDRATGARQTPTSAAVPGGESMQEASPGRGQDGAGGANGRGRNRAGGKQSGSPQGLPTASAHGQATAAGHKAPQANQSPGTGPRSTSKPARPPHPSQSTPPRPHPEPGPPPATSKAPGSAGPSAAADQGPDGAGQAPFQR